MIKPTGSQWWSHWCRGWQFKAAHRSNLRLAPSAIWLRSCVQLLSSASLVQNYTIFLYSLDVGWPMQRSQYKGERSSSWVTNYSITSSWIRILAFETHPPERQECFTLKTSRKRQMSYKTPNQCNHHYQNHHQNHDHHHNQTLHSAPHHSNVGVCDDADRKGESSSVKI